MILSGGIRSVRIVNNEDIKRLLDKVFESLTGNDLGNEGIIPRLNKFTEQVNEVLDDQEKRIAKLEWRQKIMWAYHHKRY